MDPKHSKDWRELCKAAANELDPAKLMNLIAELTKALDERDKRLRESHWENPDDRNDGPRFYDSTEETPQYDDAHRKMIPAHDRQSLET